LSQVIALMGVCVACARVGVEIGSKGKVNCKFPFSFDSPTDKRGKIDVGQTFARTSSRPPAQVADKGEERESHCVSACGRRAKSIGAGDRAGDRAGCWDSYCSHLVLAVEPLGTAARPPGSTMLHTAVTARACRCPPIDCRICCAS